MTWKTIFSFRIFFKSTIFLFLLFFLFPNTHFAKFKKSGFIRIGLSAGYQYFKETEDQNNFFLEGFDINGVQRGYFDKIPGVNLFGEVFIISELSLGIKIEHYEADLELNENNKQTNQLNQNLLYLYYVKEITKGVDFFGSSSMELGFGLGYGNSKFKAKLKNNAINTNSDSTLEGSLIQPSLYLDFGGYGSGIRLTINYSMYSWDDTLSDGRTTINFGEQMDYISISLSYRFSFYNVNPIFQ